MLARYFLVLFLSLGLIGCSEEILYQNVDNQQLKQLIEQGVTVYDIRRPDEWKQTGVLSGSRQLTFVDKAGKLNPEFLPGFTSSISKDQPVILICRTGNRSSVLAKHLSRELGYSQIYNVKNGITSWIREGGQIKKI